MFEPSGMRYQDGEQSELVEAHQRHLERRVQENGRRLRFWAKVARGSNRVLRVVPHVVEQMSRMVRAREVQGAMSVEFQFVEIGGGQFDFPRGTNLPHPVILLNVWSQSPRVVSTFFVSVHIIPIA